MKHTSTLGRVVTVMLLLVALLFQGTWALAGTTGRISGDVVDENGNGLANATVTVSSASQTTTVTTDNHGHYQFLSLAPDEYTVSVTKDGYTPVTLTGQRVTADNTATVNMRSPKALATIGKTTSKSAGNLVKAGTTSDVYNIDAASQDAVKGVGGGYNMNSAYSAIYSAPGVTSYIANAGVGQVFYIRGGSYNESGYEFDGIPVNRAFDNYNGNSLSTLGQQELQVYTGGGPASASSSVLSGFINQVIKTGTYPGYGNGELGIGTPTFYHEALVETGGASPSRNFSYYAGLSGNDFGYRTYNNQDGGNINPTGFGANGLLGASNNPTVGLLSNFWGNGPWASCPASGVPPAGSATLETFIPGQFFMPNCTSYDQFATYNLASTFDREAIVNFHFGIPHKRDGGKDDIQLLYDTFGYKTVYQNSINDQGGLATINNQFTNMPFLCAFVFIGGSCLTAPGVGGPLGNYCSLLWIDTQAIGTTHACTGGIVSPNGPSAVPILDGYIWPKGTVFGQPATGMIPNNYAFPNSETGRPIGNYGLDPAQRGGLWNDAGIIKAQYQKNIGNNAYLRLYGYSFYSDWLQNNQPDASFAFNSLFVAGGSFGASTDYELITHTRGAELQFADQINSKNLLKFTANYTTATVSRDNNSGSWNTSLNTSTTTLFAPSTGLCYSYRVNTLLNGVPRDPAYTKNLPAGSAVNCVSTLAQGTYGNPSRSNATSGGCPCPIVGAALAAGANWIVTVPGGTGTLNKIRPVFTSLALEDEWQPTDRLNINLGVRLERYQYNLVNLNDPAHNFWFGSGSTSYCYDPMTGLPLNAPVGFTTPPGSLTPRQASNNGAPGNCTVADPVTGYTTYTNVIAPSGAIAVHPDGLGGRQLYTNIGTNQLTKTVFSPRIGATFTINPDTVLRFSAGRFSQPTQTAFEQYDNESAKSAVAFDYGRFFGIGFNTPVHDNPVQTSTNIDFSLEKHMKGTDITYKISPFYRYTQNQNVTITIGPNFASAVNVGTQKSTGVEFQIQKGDPTRNGWSGAISYTYTNAKIKYNGLGALGRNGIDVLNNYITAFNKLTSAGGGADCYNPTTPALNNPPSPGCPNASDIKNPYFGMPMQPLLDRNGWYETYPNAPPGGVGNAGSTATWPSFFTGFVSWKHDRLTVTPTFVLQQGQKYGSPTNTYGIDPRRCFQNQGPAGAGLAVAPADYKNADYAECSFTTFTEGGSLAIPNPYTGKFDAVGQYRQPWWFNMGAQIKYDISPRATATLLVANLINRCFGGDKTPWSTAFPANNVVCGYGGNGGNFIGISSPAGGMTNGYGFYYGSSPTHATNGTLPINPTYAYPYQALYGALPIQAYFTVQLKI
jgi:carboxypeptidase family protein/TonB-dependent receptor-like protein